MKEKLTASRMQCWLFCQRKHLHAYDRGIRSSETKDALRFGTAWHAAQEWRYDNPGYDAVETAQGMFSAALATAEDWEEYTVAKLQAAISAWVEVFHGHDAIAEMKPEVEFTYAIEGSRTFEAAGKIDGLARLADGRTALVEHKTTSEDISPESGYWQRLRFNPQLCRYVLGAKSMGVGCDTVIYDVMRKPAIKPSDRVKDVDADGCPMVMNADGTRKMKKDGTPARTADAAKGEYHLTHAETPEEYCDRLRADMMERPDFYFARREVTVSDDQLAAFMLMEKMMARQIVDARAQGREQVKCGGRYESAFMPNIGKMTCANCDFERFCMAGIEIDPENLPQGFEVAGATPELAGK